MSNQNLAKNIKELRNRKGISQELLAEKSGVSLRTVQRIENGETEPRGDTLVRLAEALDTAPENLSDWKLTEDKSALMTLNLSALGFIVFPLLGIIIPMVIWISKKGKVRDLDKLAKSILNFQILWVVVLLLVYIYFIASAYYRINQSGDISLSVVGNPVYKLLAIGGLYLYNIIQIVTNTMRINDEKEVRYFPLVKIVR
ncbi:helix-turn-helix domain-containing protein [Maribellus sediminis]|uniref:helix-turn-helix domain-containing protein n=1 Tax=Maribellus sediminis TaxID=2696285 RepID=UPI001431955C|nr:helix-turn-helix domain-containing protein [Maribellus sediminis]